MHKVGYFSELMSSNEEVQESIRPVLKVSREMISRSQKLDYALVCSLERDPALSERLRRLRTIRREAHVRKRNPDQRNARSPERAQRLCVFP